MRPEPGSRALTHARWMTTQTRWLSQYLGAPPGRNAPAEYLDNWRRGVQRVVRNDHHSLVHFILKHELKMLFVYDQDGRPVAIWIDDDGVLMAKRYKLEGPDDEIPKVYAYARI